MSGTGTKQININPGGIIGGIGGDGADDVVNIEGTGGDDLIRPSLQNGALAVDGSPR